MKAKKFSSGAFIRIMLDDGTFGYGRLLKFPYAAFYDFRSQDPVSCLREIASKPVFFIVAIHELALETWEIIGTKPLEDSLKRPIVQFMQDIIDYRNCQIIDSEGNKKPARPEECIGLERVAIWEAEHIESRLLDTFMGRPNKSVENAKVRFENRHGQFASN